MKKEVFFLTDDGRVHLIAYLHEPSPELPDWPARPGVLLGRMVCACGGGYTFTSDREADPIALSFLAQGFHAHGLSLANHLTASGLAEMVDADAAQWFGLCTRWLLGRMASAPGRQPRSQSDLLPTLSQRKEADNEHHPHEDQPHHQPVGFPSGQTAPVMGG